MATAKDVKKGCVIVDGGELFHVTESRHVTPGNLRAFVQMKLKSLSKGTLIQKRFSSTENVEIAFLETRDAEYLYKEGDSFVFMDKDNYEQYRMPLDLVDEQMGFVKLNSDVKVTFHDGNPISIEVPSNVVLEIVNTEPGMKGNSVTNVFKPAVLETGIEVKVPLYIEIGEKIKVDTKTGEFVCRVS